MTADLTAALPTDDEDTLVRVTSDSGEPIWLDLGALDPSEPARYTGQFQVIEPVSAGFAGGGEIEALHGDTVRVAMLGLTIRLTVDGEPPTFSDVSPRSGTLQSSNSTTVEFTVTDLDSGLRTDSEDSASADAPEGADGSNPNEPLSDGNGGAQDIDVVWDSTTNDDQLGNNNWTQVGDVAHRSYKAFYDRGQLASGEYDWYITAKDRVGNYARTDARTRSGDQPYTLTVDGIDPVARFVFAGIGFDEEKDKEVKDGSSILLVFTNGASSSEADYLDTSTVSADRFDVVGNEVIDVIHPNRELDIDDNDTDITDLMPHVDDDNDPSTPIDDDSSAGSQQPEDGTEDTRPAFGSAAYDDDECDSDTGFDSSTGEAINDPANPTDCIDTRNRVYLVLANPLGDADTPDVHIVGAVRDEAGNGARLTDQLEATDRISPTLTIGISGDVETDGRPLGREEITVTVASGERLTDVPDIWLVSFDHEGTITISADGDVTPDGENAWEATFEGIRDEASVAAIIVRAVDVRQNPTTTTGWRDDPTGPAEGDSLDLAKLDKAGLIVEFDDAIPDGNVTLNPSVGDAEDAETDSFNPFIELTFGEGKENTVNSANSYEDDGVETKFDSYGRVELSDVTLDGEDVTDLVARTSSSAFDLALYGLAVGDHTLEFTATDTAGNSTTQEYDFEVLPPTAYEVTLRPGWNLVSFPGNPEDTSIDSVLSADHPATDVLAYNAGVWTSAARGDGNVWEGDLTDIDGQNAYWINTTSTRPLEAVLIQPGIGSASRPPSIQLIAGWNLIPVTDLDQEDEETAQDNYFSSMEEEDFVVAYTYDARTRSWERLDQTGTDVSDDDDPAEWVGVVENGQGVWVFSRSNVILIP